MGRLQTDADRERIVESLTNIHEAGCTPKELDATIRKLNQRWFLTRNVHQSPSLTLVQPRWALSYRRGPMTLSDIKRALGGTHENVQVVGAAHMAVKHDSPATHD